MVLTPLNSTQLITPILASRARVSAASRNLVVSHIITDVPLLGNSILRDLGDSWRTQPQCHPYDPLNFAQLINSISTCRRPAVSRNFAISHSILYTQWLRILFRWREGLYRTQPFDKGSEKEAGDNSWWHRCNSGKLHPIRVVGGAEEECFWGV